MPTVIVPTQKLEAAGLKPYPYQTDCAYEMLESPHWKTYNAYQQGTGKTIIALLYANSVFASRLLIITTASLRLNWARECQLWFEYSSMSKPAYAVLNNKDVQKLIIRQAMHPGDLPSPIITSYNLLVSNKTLLQYVLSRTWDMVICDEFQLAKGLATQTCQAVASIVQPCPRFLAMSGTPLSNSAIDIFPALFLMGCGAQELLTPEMYQECTDIQVFADKFCYMKDDFYGVRYVGAKNKERLREIFHKKPKWFFRKLLSDVTDLPPLVYNRVDLEIAAKTSLDGDHNTDKKIKRYFDEEAGEWVTKNEASMAMLRRELGESITSSPALYRFIDEIMETDGCVVLGAHHKGAIWALNDALSKKYKCVIVNGETPPANRQKAMDDFQSGKVDVFIGNLQAAGTGLNLSRANQVVVVEWAWVPDVLDQFIRRPLRIGQKGLVTAHFIATSNTFHIQIIDAVIKKQKAFQYIVDGIKPEAPKIIKPDFKKMVDGISIKGYTPPLNRSG